jgi:hypothetical protein
MCIILTAKDSGLNLIGGVDMPRPNNSLEETPVAPIVPLSRLTSDVRRGSVLGH